MQSPKFFPTERNGQPRRGGFTLVELVVFMSLLVISMVSLGYTSLSVHALRRADEERSQAAASLDAAVEELRRSSQALVGATPSWGERVVAGYAPGAVPGDTFEVPGMTPQEGQASVGTIAIISDETLTDLALGIDLGLPLDLNGDGDRDDTAAAAEATLLPAIVRVRWRGGFGDRELEQGLLLMGL
jgi:type II secretory pathway pseudopilin PulG